MKNFKPHFILLSLFCFTLSMIFAQSITVTKPRARKPLFKSVTYTIEWTKVGAMHDEVKIRLYNPAGTIKILGISNCTENDGLFSWKIPTGIPDGKYLVRVKTLDNQVWDDGGVFKILTIPEQVPRPDLIVEEIKEEYFHGPATGADTKTLVRVKAKIKNAGNAPCPAGVKVAITINGPPGFPTMNVTKKVNNSFPVGGVEYVEVSYIPYRMGQYRHRFWADSAIPHQVIESRERNNDLSSMIQVAGLPDLAVCMSHGKKPPVGGRRAINVWVTNRGEKDSSECWLEFSVGASKGTTHHLIPVLIPGGIYKVTRHHRWSSAGEKKMFAYIDKKKEVRESVERNNRLTTRYYITLPGVRPHYLLGCSRLSQLPQAGEKHCCSFFKPKGRSSD